MKATPDDKLLIRYLRTLDEEDDGLFLLDTDEKVKFDNWAKISKSQNTPFIIMTHQSFVEP